MSAAGTHAGGAPLEAPRMTDPAVRARVAVVLAVLIAVTWGAVRFAGAPGGPYSQEELRDLSGGIVVPPQIEERFTPPPNPVDSLPGYIQELRRIIEEAPQAPSGGTTTDDGE